MEAARNDRDFPIILETARECLQDVYDLDALHELIEGLAAGTVRIVEATTDQPKPVRRPRCCSTTPAPVHVRGRHPARGRSGPRRSRWTRRCWPSSGLRPTWRAARPAGGGPGRGSSCSAWRPTVAPRSAEGAADLLRVLGP
ncbi:MAG: hypothetical protein V8S24_04880, partial [Gordonibacter pamelaeae]